MTKFTVNGNPVHFKMPPETPLLWALRDAANLTGTKFGCGAGLCGACTVHVDGKAQRSCQLPIGSLEGTLVTTIEGLSDDRSHPLQQAWIAEQVPQCGYCQSGMIMAAAALLKEKPRPSDADISTTITNLCRCGTYPRIRTRHPPRRRRRCDIRCTRSRHHRIGSRADRPQPETLGQNGRFRRISV